MYQGRLSAFLASAAALDDGATDIKSSPKFIGLTGNRLSFIESRESWVDNTGLEMRVRTRGGGDHLDGWHSPEYFAGPKANR